MTNLGIKKVYRDKDYIIYISVSGDLSHSYQLVPASSERNGYIGIGYGFKDRKDANKFMVLARRYGYGSGRFKKTYDKYLKKTHFGYLPFRMALPYIKHAYGDVAKRYKKRLKEMI